MGQLESAPYLSSNQDRLEVSNMSKECIPCRIKPLHKLETIIVRNSTVSYFPMKLLNVRCIMLNTCSIKEIDPEYVFTFPDLVHLELNETSLKSLPKQINSFKTLQKLSLARNELTDDVELELPKLQEISIFLNKFTAPPRGLPDTLEKLKIGYNKLNTIELVLPNLKILSLFGNDIVEISEKCHFPELVELDISYNLVASLNGLAKITPKLKKLNCSFNMIALFPMDLPLTIEEVNASHNKMIEFFEPIVQYKSLRVIDVRSNLLHMLPTLPECIEQFQADDNRIGRVLPMTVTGLKTLNFSNAGLKFAPDVSQTKINSLRLYRNRITEFSRSCCSKHTKLIDLSYNLLSKIDTSIFDILHLRTLILVKNGISSIPNAVSSSNIRTLIIGDNPISKLPTLPLTIECVSCCHCRFSLFPVASFQMVPNLKRIDFSANKLTEIGEIPACEEICFALNEIASVPAIPDTVKVVDFSHNKLRSFVIDAQFKSVDISHNDVTFVKYSGGSCPNLETLKLSHNKRLNLILEFEHVPSLVRLDACDTLVAHTFPAPKNVIELVTPLKEIWDLTEDGVFKYFTSDVGYSEAIGMRPRMEDAVVVMSARDPSEWSYYAVIDGHGGCTTANLAAFFVPRLASSMFRDFRDVVPLIEEIQNALSIRDVADGATIALAMIRGKELGIVHMGDTRAVLVDKKGITVQLTEDHKASAFREIELLKARGTYLKDGRVETTLAVSRSLGDFAIKGVNRTPEFNEFKIEDDAYRLVICCDGVFDVIENTEIGQLVLEQPDVHKAAALIKQVALSSGSTDNISALVVDLTRFL